MTHGIPAVKLFGQIASYFGSLGLVQNMKCKIMVMVILASLAAAGPEYR
jgi:hypothetical protein